jgi:BTB/POZ domain
MEHSKRVKLNVGGQLFETSTSTLTSVEGSYFHSLLSGRWAAPHADNDGSYFIDRNPNMFHYILDFLRGEELEPELGQLSKDKAAMLKREAEFYSLAELAATLERALRPPPPPPPHFAPGPNYALSGDNTDAVKTSQDEYNATVLGPELQPGVPVTIRIVCSSNLLMMVGAAPASINQSAHDNYRKCGFYMFAHGGTKWSEGGVAGEEYHGSHVPHSSTIGVLMDGSRHVSFLVDGVNCGVAYTVPEERGVLRLAVLLYHPQDSVQLVQ